VFILRGLQFIDSLVVQMTTEINILYIFTKEAFGFLYFDGPFNILLTVSNVSPT